MNTRRRWLAAGVSMPALAWTGRLRAQAGGPVVIGWLSPTSGSQAPQAFIDGMAALGWKRGTQYDMVERFANGRADRLPALALEIAASKPAVVVVETSVAARAISGAAPTTPVVVANGDPVSTGVVTNLARPGGMITGLSNVSFELQRKLIELLLESVPTLRRIGFMPDATSLRHATVVADLRRAAEHFRVEASIASIARPEDIEPAMANLVKDKAQALVLLAGVWTGSFHQKMVDLALAQRWPVAGDSRSTPRDGGLFSYGADRNAMRRRSAHFVDRILKGAKPGDLPIEQPTAFELVINLKTARQLGITMPQSMLVRATEVIE